MAMVETRHRAFCRHVPNILRQVGFKPLSRPGPTSAIAAAADNIAHGVVEETQLTQYATTIGRQARWQNG